MTARARTHTRARAMSLLQHATKMAASLSNTPVDTCEWPCLLALCACVCMSHRCALSQQAGLLHAAGPSELLHVLAEMTLAALRPHAGLAAPAPRPPAPRPAASPPAQRLTARHPRTSQLQHTHRAGSQWSEGLHMASPGQTASWNKHGGTRKPAAIFVWLKSSTDPENFHCCR